MTSILRGPHFFKMFVKMLLTKTSAVDETIRKWIIFVMKVHHETIYSKSSLVNDELCFIGIFATADRHVGAKDVAQQANLCATRASGFPTCFDHNFLKSTNFSASRLSWCTARRDLALGTKRKKLNANFDDEISRGPARGWRSRGLALTLVLLRTGCLSLSCWNAPQAFAYGCS